MTDSTRSNGRLPRRHTEKREDSNGSKNDTSSDIWTEIIVSTVQIGILSVLSYYGSQWLSRKMQQSQLARPGNEEARTRLQQILERRADDEDDDEERRILPKLNEYETLIAEDVVDSMSMDTTFVDVGGMDEIKKELWELAVLPLLRPDLFSSSQGASSLVKPTRGILLYGRPGTGKTLMAKAIAKEAKATFIAVKLSKIMDKWFGESNKLIAATFSLAEKLAPSIIFIDEIDTFLNPREGLEGSGAAGAIKSEFLNCWDGLTTAQHLPILVLGATNRPHNVDAAILRRLPRSFCIDLPDKDGRLAILKLLLKDQKMTNDAKVFLPLLAQNTVGYSGSDLKELCRAAAMEPIRELMSETSRHAVMTGVLPKTSTSSSSPTANGTNSYDNKASSPSLSASSKSQKSKTKSKRQLIGPPEGTSVRPMSRNDLLISMKKVKRTGQAAYNYGKRSEKHEAAADEAEGNDAMVFTPEMARQLHTFMRLLSSASNVGDSVPTDASSSSSEDEIPIL